MSPDDYQAGDAVYVTAITGLDDHYREVSYTSPGVVESTNRIGALVNTPDDRAWWVPRKYWNEYLQRGGGSGSSGADGCAHVEQRVGDDNQFYCLSCGEWLGR